MKEAELKKKAIDAMRALLGERGKVLRMAAGAMRVKNGGWVRGVEAGTPDVLVMLDGGSVVWVEFKGEGGKLNDKQVVWIEQARALGHEVVVARSVEDALEPVRRHTDRAVGRGEGG